jgi:hypothetical protein
MRPHRGRRLVPAAAMSAMAVAAMLVIAPAVARASPSSDAGPLEISHDGVTFTVDGDEPLFDAIDRVVPGDRVAETLWARSAGPTEGRLGVQLTDVMADDLALSRAISIAVSVDGVPVGSVTLADADSACMVIDDSTLLQPGETARIDAELTVSAALGGPSLPGGQDGSVGFEVRLTLTDSAMPESGPGPCRTAPTATPSRTAPTDVPSTSPAGPGALPATGVTSLVLVAVAALVATVAGAAMHRSRRTR